MTRERKRMEHDEQWKLDQLREVIVRLMGLMNVWEQRRVYRFAYVVIEVSAHKGDPYFEKEPFPPVEYTTKRTQQLLSQANYQQAVKIASWQRAILKARKKA